MNPSHINDRNSERGGAGIKLLLVAVVIILIGNAGYNFVPTAFQAQSFKQDLETAVIQGVSLPSTYGAPVEIVREKVAKAARSNELPYEAVIDVKEKNNLVTARVYYVRKVQLLPFGVYDYEYVFDHTATPNGFLTQ